MVLHCANFPQQDTYEYPAFDQYSQFNGNGMIKVPTPLAHHKPSIAGSISNGFEMPLDMNENGMQRGDSNSDNEDNQNLPPAQSRRKAQNRAA